VRIVAVAAGFTLGVGVAREIVGMRSLQMASEVHGGNTGRVRP